MDDELAAIQEELRVRGFDPGPIDGVWGRDTRKAIAAMLGVTAKLTAPPVLDALWLVEAQKHLGVKEAPGANDNPAVVSFYVAAVKQKYPDSVPWCAAFVGAMLEATGYRGTGSLMARSYLQWGTALKTPKRGCVVVFKRGAAPAGHVGFVDSWNPDIVRSLGGNQSNAVSIATFPRSSVLGFRWPVEVAA